MALWIGIDPGKTGAVAVMASDGSICVEESKLIKPKKGKSRYDPPAMVDLVVSMLDDMADPDCIDQRVKACIERQHAMPGQGRTSMLTIGRGQGLWEGILAGLMIDFEVVSAVKWQKEVFGRKVEDTKKASIKWAIDNYNKDILLPTERCSTPRDGRADAICIAEYCKRLWEKG